MNIKGIFKGTVFAIIFAMLFVFLSALLTYFNIITERIAVVVSFAGITLAVFFACLGCTKTSESKLLLNSLSLCMLLSLFLFLISLGINRSVSFDVTALSLYGSVFLAGFLAVLFGK